MKNFEQVYLSSIGPKARSFVYAFGNGGQPIACPPTTCR